MAYRLHFLVLLACGVPSAYPEPMLLLTGSDQGIASRFELSLAGRPDSMVYWRHLPAGYSSGDRPALVIGLHGTDDNARQMLDFMAALPTPVPMLIVTPQSIGRGWSSADIPGIRAMLADVTKRCTYDDRRVLLMGFSAGGAMSLHLLYGEQVSVTAVAVVAGYVPPQLTGEQIGLHRDVPVFFAVGMRDQNHASMHDGLARLRAAGSEVCLYRPHIGHVLDKEVAEEALRWFFDRCAANLRTHIAGVSGNSDLAQASLTLEAMIAQARWHESEQIEAARRALTQIEAVGRNRLNQVDQLARQSREVDAVDLLRKIEADYGSSRIGVEARDRRLSLEQCPSVHGQLAQRLERQHAERAFRMYLEAHELMRQKRYDAAADCCRQLLGGFEDSCWANSARDLLENLRERVSVE